MNLLKRLYIYQDERFPLKILLFTTSAVVLSSAAILSYLPSLSAMVNALIASLLFLFHVRVIDESRDYSHDTTHHPNRPVQRGLVKIKQLAYIDLAGLSIFLFLSVFYGWPSIVYAMALLVFSFVAWKDFFMKQWLKSKFFLYNGVNMLQMVLLQLYIYAILVQSFVLNDVMIIHLLFVIWNTLLMEVVRKIKPSVAETTGNDTYSSRIGFKKALGLFYLLALLNFVTFNWMLYALDPQWGIYNLWALALFVLQSVAVVVYALYNNVRGEKFLLLSTVLNYVGLNLLVYLFNT